MQTIAKRDAVTLIRTASAERQQRRQIVALADRADAPGLLLLVPCGDAAGDAQPNLRIELDHVGRCEIMRIRGGAFQDLDHRVRRDAHLHARAGCLDFQLVK